MHICACTLHNATHTYQRRLTLALLGIVLCVSSLFRAHAAQEFPHSDTVQEGIARMYNLDFTAADQCFQSVVDTAPTHPAGHVYRAYNAVLHYLVGGHDDAVYALYTNALETAFSSPISTDDNSTEAWIRFYRGATCILRALYELHNERYLPALQWTKRGMRDIRTTAADPATRADAYTLLGLYHCIVADTPWYARALSSLLLIPPDAARGRRYLTYAVEHAELTQTEARLGLALAYEREGMYAQSMHHMTTLLHQYPDNVWLDVMRQETLLHMRNRSAALHIGTTTLARITHDTRPWIRGLTVDQHYLVGQQHLALHHYDQALVHFERAAEFPAYKPRLQAMARLHQGMVFDTLGYRELARTAYVDVINTPQADAYVQEHASAFLTHPYGADTSNASPLSAQ